MQGLTNLFNANNSNSSNESKSSQDKFSTSVNSKRYQGVDNPKLLQDILGHHQRPHAEGKLYLNDRYPSRGSVSSTYSYASSASYASSHGSTSSTYGSGNYIPNHSVYHTIHAPHHRHAGISASVSPTGELEKHHHHHHNNNNNNHHHHHHHSIQEMIRQFGRRLGHIRRQSECQDAPKKKEEEFRNRSQSLDGAGRITGHRFDADCETTYKIYESILRQGKIKNSFRTDLESFQN